MTFADWKNFVETETAEPSFLLKSMLPDAPSELELELRKIEPWYGRLTTLLAQANSHLDKAEYDAASGRADSETMLDKKIRVKAATSEQRELRDKVKGIVDAIDNRLRLGMSLMKANVKEKNSATMRERVI